MYWFCDENGAVLYVGKAKNLKRRVTSYTNPTHVLPKTRKLVSVATQLKHQVLESELEALLVEAELIRIHQPAYNILLKDDKSPLYVIITEETFPRVLTARKRELSSKKIPIGTLFGPFPSAYKVREVLRLARPIFPWCNERSNRVCFFYHLHLCPGVCAHTISSEQYADLLNQLTLFLRGKKNLLIESLRKQLDTLVEQQLFEEAVTIRDRLELITQVTSPKNRLAPDFSLPQLKITLNEEAIAYLQQFLSEQLHLPKLLPLHRIEAFDVSNTQGEQAMVAQVVAIDGSVSPEEYRIFGIRSLDTPNDYAMLQEALVRRQNHPEWGKPDLVVIDGGKGQVSAARKVWKWPTPVIGLAKDPDRLIFTLSHQGEKTQWHELKVTGQNPGFQLIQRLRDEAHRFSKKHHQRRLTKSIFTK